MKQYDRYAEQPEGCQLMLYPFLFWAAAHYDLNPVQCSEVAHYGNVCLKRGMLVGDAVLAAMRYARVRAAIVSWAGPDPHPEE